MSHHRRRLHARRCERGMVTAEAALVLPVVAGFALTLVWLVTLAVVHVRAVDAARDAAREIARGGDVAEAETKARATAGDGATVSLDRHGDDATVVVDVTSRAPAWLLVPMPDVDVRASATVAVEGDDP